MKFTVNSKILKELIDKGSVALAKKCNIPSLTTLYFEVEEDGTLSVSSADSEQYLKVSTNSAFDTEPGVCGIDIDDLKMLTKGSGLIECDSMDGSSKLRIKCGNKTLVVASCGGDTRPDVPELKNNVCLINIPESWLYATYMNLSLFTNPKDANRMMGGFHMNLKESRVETLDGHRIGTRSIPENMIENIGEGSYIVGAPAVTTFKKILDKKSDNLVSMFANDKYIWFKGNNFRYIVKRYEGKYFVVSNMLSSKDKANHKFMVDREDLISITKYIVDMVKAGGENKPMIMCYTNGNLYSYYRCARYESVDKIETKNVKMDDGFIIGVNPRFIMDAMEVIDVDEPMVYMTSPKSPITIASDDYELLVLPVNFLNDANGESIPARINALARKSA